MRHLIERAAARRLIEALGATGGLVAAVGAGGKKTTLRRLLEAHAALGRAPLALSATVTIAAPVCSLPLVRVIEPADRLAAEVGRAFDPHGSLFYAVPSDKRGRFGGVPGGLIAALHHRHRFALTLVKADGARMRSIKAPAADEPVLPPACDLVLPIVAAGALGRPLDGRTAHRPERLGALLGLAPGTVLGPAHLGRLLAHPAGALQGVGGARVVPIINAVDGVERHEAARAAARAALAGTDRFERVVLARMASLDPVIEVITR